MDAYNEILYNGLQAGLMHSMQNDAEDAMHLELKNIQAAKQSPILFNERTNKILHIPSKTGYDRDEIKTFLELVRLVFKDPAPEDVQKFKDMIKNKHVGVKFAVMHLSGFCSIRITLMHYAVYMKKLDICKVIDKLNKYDLHEPHADITLTGLCFHDGPRTECPVCNQCSLVGNICPFLTAVNRQDHQFYKDLIALMKPDTRFWPFHLRAMHEFSKPAIMSYCILGSEAAFELLNFHRSDTNDEQHFAQWYHLVRFLRKDITLPNEVQQEVMQQRVKHLNPDHPNYQQIKSFYLAAHLALEFFVKRDGYNVGSRILTSMLYCIANKFINAPNETLLRGKALLEILKISDEQNSVSPIDVRLVPTQFKTDEEVRFKAQLFNTIRKECGMSWHELDCEVKHHQQLYGTMHKVSGYLSLIKLKAPMPESVITLKPNEYEQQLLNMGNADKFVFGNNANGTIKIMEGHEHIKRLFGVELTEDNDIKDIDF